MPTALPTADVSAETSFDALTADINLTVPTADLSTAPYLTPAASGASYATIVAIGNDQLTTQEIGGTGTFDILMTTVREHLMGEFRANRISGAEYTKAYIALTESAMSGAIQFLLAKDSTYWQNLTIQAQAQTAQVQLVAARVALEVAKAQLLQVRLEGQAVKAAYAVNKMKLSTELIGYSTAAYNLEYILPQQLLLVKEQTETQRAQTLDTRTDAATIVGVLGKQKALYTQQITSYQRDAETKAGKIFSDAWITQKTIDEGLAVPTDFTVAGVQAVLAKLKLNNSLT